MSQATEEHLSDEQVRYLARHPKVRQRVKQELAPELKAETKQALEAVRIYVGLCPDNVIAVGTDSNAVFVSTRQYGWDRVGPVRVDEYSADGSRIGSETVHTGIQRGSSD